MTIPKLDDDDTITEAFTHAVAGIQFGETTDTSDASGDITITFPSAYSAAPVVVGTCRSGLDRYCVVQAVDATTVTFRFWDLSAAAVLASTASLIVNWVAIGDLA